MNLKRSLGVGISLLSLLLGACASVTPKSPDVLARAALENQLLEQGFNFTATGRVEEVKFTKQGEETVGALGSLMGPLSGLPSGSGSSAADSYLGIGVDAVKSLRFEAKGAVDFTTKRLEIAPTLRFTRRNLDGSISLPMLIDGREMALYFDAAAIDWAIPGLRERQGQLIRLPGNDLVKKLDTERLLHDMRGAARDAYGAIRNDSFTMLPLSEDDKREGVAYKVRLKLDADQQRDFTARWIDAMVRAAETQYRLLFPNEDAATVQGMGMVMKTMMSGTRSEVDSQLLIDSKGRLIGTETDNRVEQKEISMRFHTSARLSRFGQPQFDLQPAVSGAYDVSELKNLFGSRRHASDDAEADADAASAMEEEAELEAEVEEPAPVAPAAKPKAKAKAKQKSKTKRGN
ncbi:hypothetical protein [Chitinimonas taiwanensis]|uniref:hypothetical protein n=1 Tax=Chitinimonas taiwanensis TaxID=240412 RepID=UPI0035AF30E2